MKKLLLLLLFGPLLGGTAAWAQPGCQAYFNANTSGCPQVAFNDWSWVDSLSGDQVISWYWSFGDGNTSTQSAPVNTYSSNGLYGVCLTITTQSGCTSSYCDTVSINCIGGQGNCQAGFIQDSMNCPTVSFYNASGASSGIASFYYDFGDGTTSTSANPVHTYTTNGVYTVCLTIIANDSCTSTYCNQVVVDCLGGGQGNCQAGFIQDSSTNCPTITLYNASTSVSGIASYFYDFGDGSTSTLAIPTHTYTANGVYTVCMTVIANDSCTDTYCETVIIDCIAGLEENFFEGSYLSPNPTAGQLTLHLDQAQDIRYRIYGMNGALFEDGQRSAATSHNFDTWSLSEGMYLLEIETKGARKVLRFIKK